MPASNIGETARALASLSDPAGEIGKMGIPVVRKSEMIAVPLLESSINTAVVSFHFAYWSLTLVRPSTYSIRSIVRSSIRIRASSPTTRPHVVHDQKSLDYFFLAAVSQLWIT